MSFYTTVTEGVYISQPTGFVHLNFQNHVWKLHKAINRHTIGFTTTKILWLEQVLYNPNSPTIWLCVNSVFSLQYEASCNWLKCLSITTSEIYSLNISQPRDNLSDMHDWCNAIPSILREHIGVLTETWFYFFVYLLTLDLISLF